MSIFTKPDTNSRNEAVTHNRNKEKAIHSYRAISYLLLACTLFLLAVVLVLLKRGNYFSMLQDAMSDHTFQYTDNASYIQRKTQFELMPERNTDIVFLGDSITARFEWQEYFSDLTVANRGIDSDVTEGVLNRLDTVENQHPQKIFLMIGINDIMHKLPPDTSIQNYKKILTQLSEALPDCKIYVQSVLPVNTSTGIDNSDVSAFNAELRQLCDDLALPYIDLYSLMVTDDNNFTYTADGVHPTGEGYAIWMNAISEYVYE